MATIQANGSVVHYFEQPSISSPCVTAIVICSAMAVAVLVIGVLALLHARGVVNCGSIGSIPPQGARAFLVLGGACLLLMISVYPVYRMLSYRPPSYTPLGDRTIHINRGWTRETRSFVDVAQAQYVMKGLENENIKRSDTIRL